MLPTGAGEMRKLTTQGLLPMRGDWLPDGKGIVVTANEPGRGARIYVLDVNGGKPRAISPEGYRGFPRTVSPDGKFVAAQGPDQRTARYPITGGEPTPLPAPSSRDIPTRWHDARSFYVFRRGELPAKVYLFEIATGRKEPWKELVPADASGVVDVPSVCPTA